MASRLFILRQRIASSIQAAFAAFHGEVTPVLDERAQPFLADGEGGIDFDLLQQVLSRMVAASFQQMVTADRAHNAELANDVAPRTRRDQAVSAVRRKLIEIRGFAQSLFGSDRAPEIVAVDGETAYEPELLWRQAEDTLSRLEDPALVLPPASSTAMTFDPVGYAAELSPLVTTLRQVIGETQLDARVKATTQKVKDDAMAEHDLLMGACGRILSGLCLLARRQDLAKRIRIRLPSRGAANEAPSEGAPSEDAPSEDAPSEDGSEQAPAFPVPASTEPAGSQPATT